MKIYTNGATRIVFVLNKYVIKIPNFIVCHQHFLNGCLANWSERSYCKMMYGFDENKLYNLVSPSLFCSWFGLFQIQYKCDPLDRNLTTKEIKKFNDVCSGDIKKENFGIFQNRIVCLDYP